MDDHLTKPIRKAALRAVLVATTSRTASAAEAPHTPGHADDRAPVASGGVGGADSSPRRWAVRPGAARAETSARVGEGPTEAGVVPEDPVEVGVLPEDPVEVGVLPEDPVEVGVAPAQDLGPVCDKAVLERLVAELGDRATVRELVTAFSEETPPLFMDLQRGLESGDPRLVQGAAHTIRSLAATFGAERLRMMAAALELAAEDEDLIDGEVRLLEMMEHYEEALEAVRAALGKDC